MNEPFLPAKAAKNITQVVFYMQRAIDERIDFDSNVKNREKLIHNFKQDIQMFSDYHSFWIKAEDIDIDQKSTLDFLEKQLKTAKLLLASLEAEAKLNLEK